MVAIPTKENYCLQNYDSCTGNETSKSKLIRYQLDRKAAYTRNAKNTRFEDLMVINTGNEGIDRYKKHPSSYLCGNSYTLACNDPCAMCLSYVHGDKRERTLLL